VLFALLFFLAAEAFIVFVLIETPYLLAQLSEEGDFEANKRKLEEGEKVRILASSERFGAVGGS